MCLSHLHTNHLRLVMRHRALVTLTCSRKMAEESIWIAASTTDAVDAYRSDNTHAHMFRFSAAMFLTAAIIPLICVIVQDNKPHPSSSTSTSTSNGNSTSTSSSNSTTQSLNTYFSLSAPARTEAIRAFTKALSILRDISPGFGIAALMLHRRSAAIDVASTVISKSSTSPSNPSSLTYPVNSADGISDLQMDESQNLLDLFREFEKPHDEVAANQEMLFWWDGGADGRFEDAGVGDVFGADSNGGFDWSLGVPIV